MPTLANALDFSKYEGRNFRGHQLGTAPSSPVTGQLYYNTADNTLYWWDGTQWQSAKGGAPPATTTSLGTVQLAGDLTGTATSPQIAAGVITDAEVAAANKDGAAGTPSLRTIGMGALQAMAGNLPLNSITAPGAPVSMNGQRITSVADPSASTDGANKQYVDAVVQGLDAKTSVRVATTANITLSATQTIDGTLVAVNDRVLVKNQTTAAQNGIYIVQSAAWTRAGDMDVWSDFPSAYTWVEVGTANADTGWLCTNDQGGLLDSTAVTWVQFSGAGQVTAGAGLTKTGNTLDVGAGAGITVNVDSIQVATNGITNAMLADGAVNLASADVTGTLGLANGGTGQTTAKAARESGLLAAGYYSTATHAASATITITQATHGLRASRGLIVQVQEEATGNVELPDIAVAANGDVTITFGASQTANSRRVTILG